MAVAAANAPRSAAAAAPTAGADGSSAATTTDERLTGMGAQFPKCRPRGSNPRAKGLRERNSPFCTLSQNGYGGPCAKECGDRRYAAAAFSLLARSLPKGGGPGRA